MLGVNLVCTYRARRQTLAYVLLFCLDLAEPRLQLIKKTRTASLRRLVVEKSTLRYTARWLLETRLLEYLKVAKGVKREDIRG